jgi:tRNA (guanine-N7-)-methyltransferase
LAAAALKTGGYFYFVTDWESYAVDCLQALSRQAVFTNRYDGFAPRQEWRPRTRFEVKGLSAGRKIYEIYFVKSGHR